MKLSNQVAIITGGGHGIGEAIAVRFAAEGASVMLTGTGRERLEATAAGIEKSGGRARVAAGSVADEAAVVAMVAGTLTAFGRVDILVNNAGIAGPTALATAVTRAEWDETLSINLTGAFLCAKHVMPHLIAQRSGRIINVTSIAGLVGYALRSPYCASKWGMIGLTHALALEGGESGITVNAIAPGPVSGERIERVIRDRAARTGASLAEVERSYVEPTALKRFVDPADIASAAVFLASEEARSITGETISVSAGFGV